MNRKRFHHRAKLTLPLGGSSSHRRWHTRGGFVSGDQSESGCHEIPASDSAKPNSAKPNSAKPSPLAVVALRQPAHDPPRGRVASLQPNRRDRKGSLLVVVLVCLGLIGALIFAALQAMLEQRRQLGRELQMEQTRWLAEAALAQGLKRFKAEPELSLIHI